MLVISRRASLNWIGTGENLLSNNTENLLKNGLRLFRGFTVWSYFISLCTLLVCISCRIKITRRRQQWRADTEDMYKSSYHRWQMCVSVAEMKILSYTLSSSLLGCRFYCYWGAYCLSKFIDMNVIELSTAFSRLCLQCYLSQSWKM